MSHPAILTSFTYAAPDGSLDEVLFTILADSRSGVYVDWDIPEHTVETHIPGTNYTYVESLGFGLATVTWQLDFASEQDYYRFVRFIGEFGTLKVLANKQSLKGSEGIVHTLGIDYELLDQTRIAAIGRSIHQVDEWVEVPVTFSRAVDPVTRLAVVP